MKRKAKILFLTVLCVVLVCGVAVGIFYLCYTPSITFDASELKGEVTSGASGYLYGLSEEGVPSKNMTESLKISSVSAKIKDGLQHPVGDVSHVAGQLIADDSFDYNIVYLQDVYKTWYYDYENITEMKKNGTYDYKQYLQTNFFPQIKKAIESMLNDEYADKLVFCIFNECDNGVWFGRWDAENERHLFDENDYPAFNEAWKMTYDYVKSIAPDVPVGGPGNYHYNHSKMDDFLAFTSENDCTPQVLIYHELDDNSLYGWQPDVDDLHALEDKYGIDKSTPIIVTEYGRMSDNGNPAMMLRYISRIENSKVYANQAYWLMANNLCNTCADYNTPNSAWWVYRRYASLDGQTIAEKESDIFHGDVGKAIKQRRELRFKNFLGTGVLSENKDKITLLVSGASYKGRIKINGIDKTELYGKNVQININQITYQGISGKVFAPEFNHSYITSCDDSLVIDMNDMDYDTAYEITISVADNADAEEKVNENLYKRYEFEHGKLLGDAYTYNSAYATTGDENGMVGGIEKKGDGVELEFDAPKSGKYELVFVYGKANDGKATSDRKCAEADFKLDGKAYPITFGNTVRSEITDSYHITIDLEEGKHTVSFGYVDGTFVLDSMLVRMAEKETVYFEKDCVKQDRYLILAPNDGYYTVKTQDGSAFDVDGAQLPKNNKNEVTVFLRRGINYVGTKGAVVSVKATENKLTEIPLKSITLQNGAKIKKTGSKKVDCISGISSEKGSAEIKFNAEKSGTYKMTLCYSCNLENGVHDYNVDLVESYVTIKVNNKDIKNLFCRNTYADDNFTTVTTNIDLQKGENIITLTNDGTVNFNGNETFAPNISDVFINPVSVN